MFSLHSFPHTMLSLILLLLPRVMADPATLPFQDCFEEQDSIDQKFNISSVYAQVLHSDDIGEYLNLTVIGESPQQVVGLASDSSSLATLFTSTSVLTLSAWSNSTYFCSTLRPPSPLPAPAGNASNYCPLPAGPFAFSSTIPWGNHRALTTLETRLRAVDTFGKELVCLDVFTTPLDPSPNSPYGKANIIFWFTVALAIAYWVVVGLARIVSAWGRGISKRGVWARAQSAGFIIASAISGERLATSPALIRFCTPSMRDVIFHTQWCAILAMVAVEWPQFVYPLLTQAAWSTLSYNVTITENSGLHHWNPLTTASYSPPNNFADQLSDSNSPLFIDPSASNVLFMLPPNATHGMSSFAYTLGVRPQDLFPNCLIIFLAIIGATILISFLAWFIDHMASVIADALGVSSQQNSGNMARLGGTRSPVFSKELESPLPATSAEESKSLTGHTSIGGSKSPGNRFLPLTAAGGSSFGERGISTHRAWWRFRSDISSFHGSVLHGNLVRILVLFHLPVTVFSCYHMILPHSQTSLGSIVLAALSFTIFSILIPVHLVLRVTFTTTNKLYDETRTLLSLGPLYNHYRHGSQMFASLLFATNIAFGVTIGAGQKSGIAQAIIILVVEVVSALVTSIWLPWGTGASMGLISFLFCVARIVVAVLLVILTPTISIGPGPGGWVAYGILIILALVYLALLLMLIVKIIEAVVRIFGGVGFDRSRHVVDSGLLGACGMLGCCGPRKRHRHRKRHEPRYKTTELPMPTQNPARDSDVSSYIPPNILGNATPPRFLNSDSRKGSQHSGPPPSVLKPEHANRPYREDSEDEGYIMGAWQRFPRPGYIAVGDGQRAPSNPTKPTSGFSRVGGGRAHMDTPYAIASGSTHTFPSVEQQSNTMPASPVPYDLDDDDPPPSLSNVARQPEIGMLPPGAMQPSHIRTKSQSAIIEDASALFPGMSRPHQLGSGNMTSGINTGQSTSSGGMLRPPSTMFMLGGGDEDDESEEQPKKKPWYHIRRHRPSSEGPSAFTDTTPPPPPVDEELGGLGESGLNPQPQRSFVVIRKAQSTPGRGSQQGMNTSNTHPGARPPS